MHHSLVRVPPAASADLPPRAIVQLAIEADKARAFGKLFAASVLDGLTRTLWAAPAIMRTIEAWPGDLASAGVIFRLNAGVHALARSGRFPILRQIYLAAQAQDVPDPLMLDIALTQALALGEEELHAWLQGPTQTNEVARVAGLAAVLAELSARRPMRCRMLELGASAGLNLNLPHYDLTLGTLRMGTAGSPVRIAPRWSGPSPACGELTITRLSGVDLCPLDVSRAEDAERLHAYVWPGEPARSERLGAAIAIARSHRPPVERGRAAQWLERELAADRPADEAIVVFHSMVLQYMPPEERARIDELLTRVAAAATPPAPLVRIGTEWNADRSAVEVRVTCWDGGAGSGATTLAARCTPYAEAFEWLGLGSGTLPG